MIVLPTNDKSVTNANNRLLYFLLHHMKMDATIEEVYSVDEHVHSSILYSRLILLN